MAHWISLYCRLPRQRLQLLVINLHIIVGEYNFLQFILSYVNQAACYFKLRRFDTYPVLHYFWWLTVPGENDADGATDVK